ncbi:ribonuclease Y [Pelolinea submarina]|uniref:Ribonuclease Y n=1 Tax=Pelolinea submarina TaxID=913107 RepID=A0A347ZSJ4_9CHLR|nr:ribonuclease Y [Pelolinea submarina]REG11158.1 ribonuclease Y [Pelolinea submarina]BBB48275.1 ribonucrease Y [Pelolinea submarina]
MNTGITIAICVAAVLILSFVGGQMIARMLRKSEREKTEQMLQEAKEKAKVIELEARDTALKIKQDSESEISRRRNELSHEDERLQKRRAELDTRIERLEQREAQVNKRQSSVDRRANEIEKLYSDQMEKLQEVSHMTVEEAKQELLNEVEKEARADMARIVRQIEAEARQEGDKRARELITETIQRVASDQVAQVTTSTVSLPNEEMKGRIVGRNGRNIRAFEQAAGVDVIVDDTPEAVTISCFDPTRREIARRSLERLISDGRIHPAHIEKILAEEEKEVQRVIEQAGEQAAFDAGVAGLPLDVLRMLGRLKFRTSYGQNQLTHAVETAMISGLLAVEIGADTEVAKAAGLLHDIGKAMDHNTEGTHAVIGAEFCRRYRVNPAVINAIESHHHETEQQSLEAVIVESADAISGARPGARRENLEQYVKRLRALEEMAHSYKGVSQAYAIQAGREVRIIVKPETVDDFESTRMAREIAKNIEETMQYPGQIKVTVIREMRAVEFAK